VSNAQFDAAASSVLEEMNRRLGMKGTAAIPSSILQGRELGKAQETLEAAERARAEIRSARPIKSPKRFSNAHSKQFAKMESIADYATRRDKQKSGASESLGPIERKRKSGVLDDSLRKPFSPKRGGMPGGFGGDDEEEEKEGPTREAKRVRVSEAPGVDAGDAPRVKIADTEEKTKQDQSEKEKEAIKRKLEASRARRRSSKGRPSVGGRTSAGKVAPQGMLLYHDKVTCLTLSQYRKERCHLPLWILERGCGRGEECLESWCWSTNSGQVTPTDRSYCKTNCEYISKAPF
jgi:hypothetical protein